MDITIKINCDNAAFEGAGLTSETARILKNIAANIDDYVHGDKYVIMDVNGNKVGEVQVCE